MQLTVGSSGVNVLITVLESSFNRVLDFTGLRLPGAEPDSGHNSSSVKSDGRRGRHFCDIWVGRGWIRDGGGWRNVVYLFTFTFDRQMTSFTATAFRRPGP